MSAAEPSFAQSTDAHHDAREVRMTARRMILGAAATVVAAAVATTALAAGALKDPKTLVLQKSDFPAGARIKSKGGTSAGGYGAGYSVTFSYRTRSKPNELSSSVSVWKSRSVAIAGFRELKGDVGPAVPRIPLPKYGDEQIATFHSLDGGRLIVRKNTVVWVLELQSIVGSRELTKAEAVAELKRYGPKQKKRVGSG
jgi:hypothetical protein